MNRPVTARARQEPETGGPGQHPDNLLLARVAAGDLSQFDILVDRYKKRVFRFVRVRVGDWHVAHDLSQETFLRLFRAARARSYDGRASVGTWLFTIARNCTTDYLRSLKREHDRRDTLALEPEAALDARSSKERGPHESASVREQVDRARRLLAELPDEQREVIELKLWAGLTFPQIAELTGRPVTTVKSQMAYGLAKLGRGLA